MLLKSFHRNVLKFNLSVDIQCFVCGRSRVCFPKAGQTLHSVANGSPTTSTSMQVVVLPWRYDVEMGTANSLHASG